MSERMYEHLAKLLAHELVPALGCTEPIAIAYCSACACKALGEFPQRLYVAASANIIKNVKSVIVPNSEGMKGLAASAILGAVSSRPELKLEVLSALDAVGIQRAKALAASDFCLVERLESPHPLHLIVRAEAGEHSSLAEIVDQHTNLVQWSRDGQPWADFTPPAPCSDGQITEQHDFAEVCLSDILTFAAQADLALFKEVVQRQLQLNRAICHEGLQHPWGAEYGRMNLQRQVAAADKYMLARQRALAYASAGSDARMSGCVLPVVINSGSGNQGMTVSMPVWAFAETFAIPEERYLRALALANLLALYQKANIGRLSAFCGAVSAATGAVAAIAWMLGAERSVIEACIINSLATVAGMVCDGAKASCAAKITCALNCAFDAYEIARAGRRFPAGDGLVKADADRTIQAVGRMAAEGMRHTDAKIIELMLAD